MIQKFDVYLKEGATFTVEMAGFQVQNQEIVLMTEMEQRSSEGFLSFHSVAAIVPQTYREDNNTICFNIYLKGIEKAAQVYASAFDMSDNLEVKFVYRQRDIAGNVYNEWPIKNIYIALTEVAGIFPADGLKYRER